ncbi:hypothetical protein SLS62_011425 [Diatrype stigma]|uniref:Uncharacterized protein n=1 Tax=Diatrype stigma TaxID=117547 RepID=A0AAN9U2L7_9PEZI
MGIKKIDDIGPSGLDVTNTEPVSEEGSVLKLGEGADEAGAFAGTAHGITIGDETNRTILRKIYFRLMPIMSGLYAYAVS